jgi:hypothetical protein
VLDEGGRACRGAGGGGARLLLLLEAVLPGDVVRVCGCILATAACSLVGDCLMRGGGEMLPLGGGASCCWRVCLWRGLLPGGAA